MRQMIINCQNMKVRVCKWGNKKNPTILCFHGLGSTNLSFIELGELLNDKYYIVSIELPGHGKTPALYKDEDYAIPNLIKWVSEVIKIINVDTFYLLAHSWGGCIALYYAAQYPEKVKKILLLDGGYHSKQAEYEYFSKINNNQLNYIPPSSLEDEIKTYKEDFDGYVFSDWNVFLNLEKNNYLRWSKLLEQAAKDLMKEESNGTIRFCASGDTARAAIQSMYNYPTENIYEKIKAIPILLLQAKLPASWNEIRDIMVAKFQKGTNCMVKKVAATHLLHWDNPFLIKEEIIDWMK